VHLREAIEAANANNNDTTTVDVINFAIPGAGPHTISPTPELPPITEAVTINGYSESTDESTPAKENTLAIGNNAKLLIELRGADAGNGLKLEAADDSTVKGLVISNWENGVFLTVDPMDNDNNATGNTVRGNFIGTDPSGTVTDPDGISNNGDELGNTIGVALTNASNNTIGGTTAAARNIISGNGAGISISGGTENKVQGNYIGTNAAGDTKLGNNQGMALSNTSNNTIGGTTAATRNIISGNGTWGILISDLESTGNTVQGNYIGTDVTGTLTDPNGTPNSGDELGNGLNGVVIRTGAANNTIGGTTATAGNIISGNGNSGADLLTNTLSGVEVQFDLHDLPSKATGNRILSNSIYDNVKLGIDLYNTNNPPGVTANDPDPGDTDDGPNHLQNYPEITSAKPITKRIRGMRRRFTVIAGTLNSTPGETFTIQLFSNPVPDPSGYAQGKTLIGQTSVTTDPTSGNATFAKRVRRSAAPVGSAITATATNNSTGDTSEFSAACSVGSCPVS
jgi:parallel beta-helix repeat protein